jgi:predicted nucleic acid-binding Zn ribbon protein
MPDNRSPHGVDRRLAAAEALQEAKADAFSRGNFPQSSGVTHIGKAASAPGEAGQSSRRARRDDPQLLTAAIGGLLDEHGWQQRAAMGSVFGRWADIVGADLAAHTKPDSFADGELAVLADSTAWATQVRLLAPMLVRRLNEEVGQGAVRRVKVRGPAPPRQRGGWRVPGSRGPGDTYG